VSAEMKAYQPIPVIVEFKNEDGSDNLKETIEANYRKVKQEILSLVDFEIKQIKKDPILSNLIKGCHSIIDIKCSSNLVKSIVYSPAYFLMFLQYCA
jgi:hypothetical protein